MSLKNEKTNGFTIVELLVVIVVIGILSAITIVSYIGITQKANEVTIVSDLASAKDQLLLYYSEYGSYPTGLDNNNCPSAPNIDNDYCLRPSSGAGFSYYGNDKNFMLSANKGSNAATVSSDIPPAVLSLAQPSSCPSGFIPVPGSVTYGTSGFCVMKYEAKNAGSNVPTSTASGAPWVAISQTNAINYSHNVAGCTGCHLITEAQWMTLAKNILSVASNWSGGAVGSGYMYSGHNDNAPASALVADASDANGYAGETNVGGNQKRTLTLTNGEVIWDLAGNVSEWTSGQTASNLATQPGVIGNLYSSWIEWPSVTSPGSLAVNVVPAGTGISGSGSWIGASGVGKLMSNPADKMIHGFTRGGYWNDGSGAGALSLNFGFTPGDDFYTNIGFRVAQ